jgi:hypothetical protein
MNSGPVETIRRTILDAVEMICVLPRLAVTAICLCLAGCKLPTNAQPNRSAPPTYYVGPQGDDGMEGTSLQTAWRTLPWAISQLRGGDTLTVLPGDYYLDDAGLVLDSLDGTAERPTRIVSQTPGKARLIVDPTRVSADAPPKNWENIGERLYSRPLRHPERLACGFAGDVYFHNYRRLDDLLAARNRTEGYHRGGDYFDGPDYGLAQENEQLFVKIPPGVDPDQIQFVWNGAPAVSIHRSPNLVFDGFCIEGRSTAIHVTAQSPGVMIRNCLFKGATYGVMTDADFSVIEWCELYFPGLSGFNRELMKRGTLIYYFMKDRGLEGGMVYSFKVPSPRFMEARYNYIHDMFDGDGLGQFDDSVIHHNVYHDCFDNAVELEPNVKGKAGRNLRFCENWISGYSRGIISHQQNGVTREQAIQGGWRMEGPHFVHHNIIIADGNYDQGWRPWTVIKCRPWNDTVKIHYYHNLILARTRTDLFWNDSKWQAGLANMEWKNNVLLFPKWISTAPPPFTGEANALVAPHSITRLVGPHGIHSEKMEIFGYHDTESFDPRPPEKSPILAIRVILLDTSFIDDLQNTTVGPFTPDTPAVNDWPRPHHRHFSAEPSSTRHFIPPDATMPQTKVPQSKAP